MRRENFYTWYLTENFEAIWGCNGFKSLTLVYSHSNIILQWYFLLEAALRPSSQTCLSLWPQDLRTASSQKYHCNMIFESEYTNVRLLRPLWPQIASKFLVRYQVYKFSRPTRYYMLHFRFFALNYMESFNSLQKIIQSPIGSQGDDVGAYFHI